MAKKSPQASSTRCCAVAAPGAWPGALVSLGPAACRRRRPYVLVEAEAAARGHADTLPRLQQAGNLASW